MRKSRRFATPSRRGSGPALRVRPDPRTKREKPGHGKTGWGSPEGGGGGEHPPLPPRELRRPPAPAHPLPPPREFKTTTPKPFYNHFIKCWYSAGGREKNLILPAGCGRGFHGVRSPCSGNGAPPAGPRSAGQRSPGRVEERGFPAAAASSRAPFPPGKAFPGSPRGSAPGWGGYRARRSLPGTPRVRRSRPSARYRFLPATEHQKPPHRPQPRRKARCRGLRAANASVWGEFGQKTFFPGSERLHLATKSAQLMEIPLPNLQPGAASRPHRLRHRIINNPRGKIPKFCSFFAAGGHRQSSRPWEGLGPAALRSLASRVGSGLQGIPGMENPGGKSRRKGERGRERRS